MPKSGDDFAPNKTMIKTKHNWDALRRDIKPIYMAPGPTAEQARNVMVEHWGGKYPAIAGKKLVGRVHSLPGLQRRNQESHLLDQRHRILERKIPPLRTNQGPFLHRASSTEMLVFDRTIVRLNREKSGTLDLQMETRPQRVLFSLCRPLARHKGTLKSKTPVTHLLR
jgi:hypothetical protein